MDLCLGLDPQLWPRGLEQEAGAGDTHPSCPEEARLASVTHSLSLIHNSSGAQMGTLSGRKEGQASRGGRDFIRSLLFHVFSNPAPSLHTPGTDRSVSGVWGGGEKRNLGHTANTSQSVFPA